MALSYHLGARHAAAQAGTQPYGFCYDGFNGHLAVITANGDVYERTLVAGGQPQPLVFAGNFWSGGAVSTTPQTWGRLKARYR